MTVDVIYSFYVLFEKYRLLRKLRLRPKHRNEKSSRRATGC